MSRTFAYDTWIGPLGPMLLAASAQGLVGAWFHDQKSAPNLTGWIPNRDHPAIVQAREQLAQWFCGERQAFELPLDLQLGTPFQQAVWNAILQLPRGQTASYADISQRIERPQAFRAVGTAIGRNPLLIVVPCHRVVSATGAIGGYAAGVARKRALLQLEGVTA